MKKNKLKIAFISAISLFLVASGVSSSLAWLIKRTDIGAPTITGETEGAYFAGGDGSEEHPYIINKPIHVYNLAWLQYLGEFNKKTGTTLNKQFHFVIEADIDMGGMAIPPIGTTANPFVGNLDANGHVVQNFTTSNNFSDFDKKPYALSSSDFRDVNIVGFFGVVGTLSGDTTLTYDTSKNEISNLGLKDFTVKTNKTQTLAGLAVGYVNGNVDGVGVIDGKLNIASTSTPISTYGNKFSNYGTVGYCTSNYMSSCEVNETNVRNPKIEYSNSDDGGDQWGASIAMENMYNDIKNAQDSSSTVQYVSRETRYYDENDNLVNTVVNQRTDSPSTTWNGSTTYSHKFKEKFDSNSKKIASYSFIQRTDTQNYMYMSGIKDFTVANKKTVIKNGYNHITNTMKISDGNGNYMKANGTLIENTTNSNEALSFAYQNNNLTTVINGVTYYLGTQNGTTMELATDQNNGLNFNISNNHITVANYPTIFVTYDNGWTFGQTTLSDYFYLKATRNSTSRYVKINGSSAETDSSKSNATKLYMDSNNQIHTSSSGGSYIRATVSSGGWSTSYGLTVDTTNQYRFTYNANNKTLTTTYTSGGWWSSTTTIYCSMNSSNPYSLTGGTSQNTTFDMEYDYSSPIATLQMPTGDTLNVPYTNQQSTEDAKYTTPETYIPLTWKEDTNNTVVSDKNTGYLVSGTHESSSIGDIRVSKYNMYDISTSLGSKSVGSQADTNYGTYNDSKIQIITRNQYTNGNYVRIKDSHNSSNFVQSPRNNQDFYGIYNKVSNWMNESDLHFEKYQDSRSALYKILNSKSSIYGLHFMDSTININNYITAETVKINGENNISSEDKSYSNFQLPEDCIDFNLKKKGVCNFFGGSYFPGNTAFFSLHEITRNSSDFTKLQNIREIKAVYLRAGIDPRVDSKPYVYQYVGESSAPAGSTGSPLFETAWITNPSSWCDYALYYFEIPLNPGEYALGSVANKAGAYLVYLDIGAAKKTVESTIIKEKMIIVTKTYQFPKGVDFVEAITSGTYDFASIEGGEVATVVIPSNGTGIVCFTLADSILTCGPPTSGNLSYTPTSTFVGLQYTLKANNQTIVPTATTGGSKEVLIITEYDFEPDTNLYTTSIVKETTEFDVEGHQSGDVIRETSEESELNVQTNPWDGVQEYESDLSKIISALNFYSYSGEEVTLSINFNPLTYVYTLTFSAEVDVDDFVVKFDSSHLDTISSNYSIVISNIPDCEPITGDAVLTFDITATAQS